MIDSVNPTSRPQPTRRTAQTAQAAAGTDRSAAATSRPISSPPMTSIEDGGRKVTARQGATSAANVNLSSPSSKSRGLEQAIGRFASAAEQSNFDWQSLIEYLVKENLMGYRLARSERKADLQQQVSSLKSKSDDIKKEARMELIGGAIQGAAEIGAGIAQGAGGAKGLKAMQGAPDMQSAAALSQSTQMRFTAVSDSITATGKISSASADFEATETKAKETADDTEATRAGTYVSQTSEDMQNLWSLLQAALEEMKAQIETRHEAAEKSFY